MNQPTPESDGLPHWKLRLLERIQNTSAEHARVLRQGYPVHQLEHGSTQIPIQTWRAHLRALESDRTEIEIHATAVGVPTGAIEQARTAGQRGQRWGDRVHTPPTLRHGEDPVRAHMIEGIASDVWQLEHMAALDAEYQRRSSVGRFPLDQPAAEQLQRNMIALWARADAAAHVLELSPSERAALWDRDHAGWRRLIEVTVHRDDDLGLQERWYAYAWRGIELDVERGVDNLAAGPVAAQRPAAGPPTPQQMIQRAADALAATGPAPTGGSIGDLGRALDAAMLPEFAQAWVRDPAEDWDRAPDAHPPDPGAAAGPEL